MGVTFGGVTVHRHARVIDRSKLPSDGVAPLGLGQRIATENYSSLDQFEVYKRESCKRKEGSTMMLWFHVPPELRCELLEEFSSAHELEDIARENAGLLETQGRADLAETEDAESSSLNHFARGRRDTDLHGMFPRYSTAGEDEKREGVRSIMHALSCEAGGGAALHQVE